MQIKDQTNIQDKNLLENLVRYAEIKQDMDSCKDESIEVNLSRIRFAYPMFLNLLLLTRDQDTRIRFIGSTSYLDAISYPKAKTLEEIKHLTTIKTYIPLISDLPEKENLENSSVADKMLKLITSVVTLPVQVKSGIRYMIQEIVDNVTEHSMASRFYLLAQAYPNKKFIDICLADNGISLRRSYNKAGMNVKSDLQAMKMMASAISSKDRPDNESRGYGLFTSRKMTTEGLDGEFVIISGKAAYAKIKNKEYFLDLPFCNTKGTAVALRLKYDNPNFNMYNYLEY